MVKKSKDSVTDLGQKNDDKKDREIKKKFLIKKCEETVDIPRQKHGSLTEPLNMQNAFIFPASECHFQLYA